ncbi:MAG: DUF6644 family protein [Sphingomonadaceae bacterium]
MEALAAAIEASQLGQWARGSALAYPVANTLHLLGLVLLLGAIGLLDLRLAGAWRKLPLPPLAATLTPLAVLGFLLLLATGAILFAADARALVRNPVFLWKVGLVGLALLNAAVFRLLWKGGEAPAALGFLALVSLGLWLAVGALGRWIAYV